MYAIIRTGGKQYRVQKNEEIIIERLLGDVGTKIVFDEVLLIGENGKTPTIGAPTINGAAVKGEIIDQAKADKLKIVKFQRRKRHLRVNGHRQKQTHLKITDINLKAAPKTTDKA